MVSERATVVPPEVLHDFFVCKVACGALEEELELAHQLDVLFAIALQVVQETLGVVVEHGSEIRGLRGVLEGDFGHVHLVL